MLGALLGGLGKVGAGYGIMKGSGMAADYMESSSSGMGNRGIGDYNNPQSGRRIGGAYSSMLRIGGAIAGGGMMAGVAIRGAGNIAGKGYAQYNRGGMLDVVKARRGMNDASLSTNATHLVQNKKVNMAGQRAHGRNIILGQDRVRNQRTKNNPHRPRSKKSRIFERRRNEKMASLTDDFNQNQIAYGNFKGHNLADRAELNTRRNRLSGQRRAISGRLQNARTGNMGAMNKLGVGHDKLGSFIGSMQNFSSASALGTAAKYAGIGGMKGAGVLGKAAVSPLAPVADVAGLAMRAVPGLNGAGRGVHRFMGKHMGTRMFGWGAAAGAAKLGLENGTNMGARLADGLSNEDQYIDQNMSYDATMQSYNSRGLSMAGQQTWNPNSGSRPRGMDLNTSGLTQSLHRLR